MQLNFRVILFFNAVFLITGILQHLVAYELDDNGFGKKIYNNVLASCQPLGYVTRIMISPLLQQLLLLTHSNVVHNRAVIVSGIVCKSSFMEAISNRRKWLRKYSYLIPLDLLGGVCTQISIALIGSGIFTVVYSVVVGFIAILGRIQYPSKKISYTRWFFLATICLSVSLSAIGEILENTQHLSSIILGVSAALGAVVFYGALYLELNVVLEKDDAPNPVSLCVWISALECVPNLFYFLFVTCVYWNDWIIEPVLEGKGSTSYIIILLVIIIITDGFHQIGFFQCCSFGKIAAITSGVNKSAQAVGLFVFSDLIFCGESGDDKKQCMNTYKIIGTVGVSISVLAYALDGYLFYPCLAKDTSKPAVSYERLDSKTERLGSSATTRTCVTDASDDDTVVTTRRKTSEIEVP